MNIIYEILNNMTYLLNLYNGINIQNTIISEDTILFIEVLDNIF